MRTLAVNFSGAPPSAFVYSFPSPVSTGNMGFALVFVGEDTMTARVRTIYCGAGGGWCRSRDVAGTVTSTEAKISFSTEVITRTGNLSGAPHFAFVFSIPGPLNAGIIGYV